MKKRIALSPVSSRLNLRAVVKWIRSGRRLRLGREGVPRKNFHFHSNRNLFFKKILTGDHDQKNVDTI